jgi:hypothetical protein
MRSKQRRIAFIAACAFGLVIAVGLVAERQYAARTPSTVDQAKPATPKTGSLEGATQGTSVSPSTTVHFVSSAPAAESTTVKPVVIGTVKPWIEIARMPPYVKANSAERMAIRDLYWRTCVEEKLPPEQRTSAYWQFVRSWEGIESGAPGAPSRTTSGQLLREQQPRVPSPIDAETMQRLCRT